MNKLLYRVKNLSKSNDKRLQKWAGGYAARKRGDIGTLRTVAYGMGGQDTNNLEDGEVFILVGNDDKDWLTRPTRVYGVYHRDELELVTKQQLRLESAVLGLLAIFPNKNPELALMQNQSIDDLRIAHMTVKTLRKLLKNHPIMEQLRLLRRINNAQGDMGQLTTELSLAEVALDSTVAVMGEIHADIEDTQNRIDKYNSKLDKTIAR